ncbi:VirK/YbjX family protein [Fusobacteria bacterium ZRK30]|nr:VirK/YbjX family protein [Fusobacteria bacterium ZRK30]
MKNIKFYYKLIKQGSKKGQLNTRKKKIRFSLRTMIFYPWMTELTDFIRNHDYLSARVFEYPILMSKIHRPYLSNSFKVGEKIKTIKDSYRFIDKYLSPGMRERLYTDGKIKIGEIRGNKEEVFEINLALYPHYDKEGEFNLILTNSDKVVLSTLTFSLQKVKDGFRIFVGGLQGAGRNVDHNIIKAATKSMYGIFPKKVVMESLYFLEKTLDMEIEKVCVGNAQHVYGAKRYKRKRTIHSSYDEFWESLNGKILNSGLWLLPKKLERKDILEVASKKRGQYRKKYNLLDQLEGSILNTVKGV